MALPNEEMAHSARMMTKRGNERAKQVKEEKEKMKTVKQIKSRTVPPKQTSSRHELKMVMKRSGESKHVGFCKAGICSFPKSARDAF